jgi:hypothetical protein
MGTVNEQSPKPDLCIEHWPSYDLLYIGKASDLHGIHALMLDEPLIKHCER